MAIWGTSLGTSTLHQHTGSIQQYTRAVCFHAGFERAVVPLCRRCANSKATWNEAAGSLTLVTMSQSPASYLHSSLGCSEQHQLFMVLSKAPIRWQLWPQREQGAVLQILTSQLNGIENRIQLLICLYHFFPSFSSREPSEACWKFPAVNK